MEKTRTAILEETKPSWKQAYQQAEWFREQNADLALKRRMKGPKPKFIITLDPSLALRAERLAMREGVNIQTILRKALYEHLERNQR